MLALGVGLGLLVWRLPELIGGGRPSGTVSRESAFLLNNVLFLGLTFAVLFGTLLPLLVAATSGDTISVGAPWFNGVTVPIFVALLFLMGIGPALPWGAASWATLRDASGCRCSWPVLLGVAAFALGLRAVGPLGTLVLSRPSPRSCSRRWCAAPAPAPSGRGEDPATAAWRLATRNRRRYGGYAVHLGVLVMAIAVAVSSGLAIDRTVTLRARRVGGDRRVRRARTSA